VAAPHGPALGPLRRTIREIGLALITAGVVVLLFVLYQLFGTNLTESSHQSSLARQFHTATALVPTTTSTSLPTSALTTPPTTADVLPSVPSGGAIDHLQIPAIGVDKYVVEGTDENNLREGPGHYTGTAYPGQVGNTAIAGHRTTYGAPFFELNNLKTGDKILLTDLNDHTWIYVVDQAPVVVSPSDVSVLDPTTFAQLTLTTCNPRFEATNRLVVFAKLQGKAGTVTAPTPPKPSAPAVLPGDGPTQVAAAGINLGHGQSGAWPPSIVYGAVVVILWVGTRLAINRTRRWWRLGAYVVGIGICLIPLWFCFENVILLLPQSI
jgi:sortase A